MALPEALPETLTMKEMCALGRICMSTLYKHFKAGDGPKTFRIGVKGRRVRREVALQWLQDLENRSTDTGLKRAA